MSAGYNGESPDISAIIAKACADYGVTAGQISGLANILSKLNANTDHGDWESAARLLSRQPSPSRSSTQADVETPHWTAPIKITPKEALAVLDRLVPELHRFCEDEAREAVIAESARFAEPGADKGAIATRIVQALRDQVIQDDDYINAIGETLHAAASLGHRPAMWTLAHSLRVIAVSDSDDEDMEHTKLREELRDCARLWETLAARIRPIEPKWSEDEDADIDFGIDGYALADRWLARVSGRLEILLRDTLYRSPGEGSATASSAEENDGSGIAVSESEAIVLDRIGGASDPDDESSWKRIKPWRVLLKPLPIVGRFDPDETYRALRQEFPWMEEANRRVCEMIAGVRGGRRRLGPMLLIGEPGIGKTAWASRVAELCELPRTVVSATTGTSMLVAGDEREWTNSAPSLAAKVALDKMVANPMIILDELDKSPGMGPQSNASSIHDALLPVLDTNDKRPYYDLFLQGNMDLSRFSWFFLANGLEGMSAPLIDRLAIVRVERPSLAQVERALDAMVESWLPGEVISPATRQKALAKFSQTQSLRDVRQLVEQANLQTLWQAPGPREVVSDDQGS